MTMLIKIKDIVPNSWNKRGNEGIEALSASIAARGLIQPIVVRPVGKKYEIVAGERRWRACKANKSAEIDATVREIDEVEARAITLVENMERKRLSPFEEMEEIAGLHDAGQNVEEIAAVIGRSVSFVRRRLLLKNLDLEALRKTHGEAVVDEAPLLALELLAAAPADRRVEVPYWALDNVNRMKRWLLRDEYDVKKARWLKADMFDGLPACAACSSRTLAEGVLFPELADGDKDVCLSPGCWAKKALAFAQRVAAKKSKLFDVVLLGDDHDTAAQQDAGVQRSCDYLPAKKGEDGALQAVYADGQNAGQAVWVKPVRAKVKPAKEKKKRQNDPDANKWAWICEQAADRVGMRDGNILPVHDESIDPSRRMIRDMVRLGVNEMGLNYTLPENDKDAVRDLLVNLEDGGVNAIWNASDCCTYSPEERRRRVLIVLEVFFGVAAAGIMNVIEKEWEESVGKPRGKGSVSSRPGRRTGR